VPPEPLVVKITTDTSAFEAAMENLRIAAQQLVGVEIVVAHNGRELTRVRPIEQFSIEINGEQVGLLA
jgi:hypothetical protein